MQVLEKYFDMAFDAPDGIKQLRELILTLAMQGKLVPQDPNDQPAIELLKEIEKKKKVNKVKSLEPIKSELLPYDLPNGWQWVYLNDFGVWKSGSTPSRTNSAYYGGDIPWVKSGEVKQGLIKKTEETITQKALDECSLGLNPVGSVLVAMYGANIGEVGILEVEATTNQAICTCQTFGKINNQFLKFLIYSLKGYFISQGAGAAQPNISRVKIINSIVPLPPFNEQQRIVEKINQLMALCDELEKLKEQKETKKLTVHKSAINQLLDSKDESNRQKGWHFISNHFNDLYTVKENVSELRNTILQLAMQGKLVPQDPNDQPAIELLKEIEKDKQSLTSKPEQLYTIPSNWIFVNLKNISDITGGYAFKSSQYTKDGIRVIRISDFDEKGIKNDSIVRHPFFDKLNNFKIEKNDILIAMTGGTVGKSYFVKNITEPMFTNQRVATIKINQAINQDYIYSVIKSENVQKVIQNAKNSTNDNISMSDISNFIIPLPPLNEQQRIVEKINQLMALCDELEKQIENSSSKQTQLLNAIMSNLGK